MFDARSWVLANKARNLVSSRDLTLDTIFSKDE
jgi:hypothetical protein